MTVTQYIGARYVPLFSEPLDWDITKEYEPLTIVYNAGNSYTSRQAVPTGIDISNTDYWALTGNYNAQIEQYRKEVAAYDARITANADGITTETSRATTAENELATGIANEIARARESENELATGLSNEKTRAETVEKNILENLNYALEYKEVYVNASTGDDSNSGDADNPLKTLDGALSLIKKGYTSIGIHITTSDTYTSSITTINNAQVHINGSGATPKIVFDVFRVYNCYFNFSNINLTCTNGFHADFCGIYVLNSTINVNAGYFNVNVGSSIEFAGTSTVNTPIVFDAKDSIFMVLSGATLTWNCTGTPYQVLMSEGGKLCLYGTVNFSVKSGYTGKYIDCRGGTLHIYHAPTFSTLTMDIALAMYASLGIMPASVYNTITADKMYLSSSQLFH